MALHRKYLWRRVRGSPALLELLHEHLADDHVVLVPEHRREHHRHAVRLRLHVPTTITVILLRRKKQ